MTSAGQYLPGGGRGPVRQWWGIYQGYISVNVDPLAQGRVKLRVPQVFAGTTSGWALPMVPLNYVPQVGTQVTVMFVGGDPTQPVWFGNFAIPGGAVGWTFSATEPTDPEIGQIWVNTANGLMSEWNGASWIAYQIGGGAIQNGVTLSAPNITGGVITGAQFIADGTSGEYLGYTGTPALGNLFFSVSPDAGTDPETNAYLEGVTVYDGAAHIQMHVNSSIAAPAIEMVTGLTSEHSHASLFTWSPSAGAANEAIESEWLGPASSWDSDQPSIILQGSAKDGSSGSGVVISNGRISGRLPIVQTGNPNGIAQAPAAVGSANATNISTIWTAPAGDARTGTLYRIKGFGYTDGAGSQIVLRVVGYGGTFLAGVTIAAGAFGAAGVTLDFDFEATIRVQAVSATVGSAAASFSGNISVDGQPLTTGTSTQNSFGFNSNSKGSAATGLNTLGASLFAVQAYFPSTPSPSNAFVECTYDSFERWGP